MLTFSGLCVAGGAAPAYAYTGYQVVERTFSLPAGGYVRQIAQCPAGTVVLGGGADVVGAGSVNHDTDLQESTPGTNSAGYLWLATVSNASANNYTLGIWAVCGAAPSGYQIVRGIDVTLPKKVTYDDSVSCPSGEVVLAGGVSVVGEGTGEFGIMIRQSAPGTNSDQTDSDGTWWLADFANMNVNPHTIEEDAVCADPPAGYQIVHTTFTLPFGYGTNFVRNAAACPAGKVVLGGGASAKGAYADSETGMQESAPGTASGGSLWLAASDNFSSTPYTLSIWAVCVS
jgi:hypothetical protein